MSTAIDVHDIVMEASRLDAGAHYWEIQLYTPDEDWSGVQRFANDVEAWIRNGGATASWWRSDRFLFGFVFTSRNDVLRLKLIWG